jgi:ADP-ribosylglycohydrolase
LGRIIEPDRLKAELQASEIEEETPLLEIARRFGCSRYVAESVPLALRGASRIRSLDFKTVLVELIACGGAADTNASMAGQAPGVLIGRIRFSEVMIARTPDRDAVESIAIAFAESLDFYE